MEAFAVILIIIGALALLGDAHLIMIVVVGIGLVWLGFETNWFAIRLVAGKIKGVARKKKK